MRVLVGTEIHDFVENLERIVEQSLQNLKELVEVT